MSSFSTSNIDYEKVALIAGGTLAGLALGAFLGRRTAPGQKISNVFSGLNRPTAGPRETRELPRGLHSLQLYSLGTPNGQKVTIMLEELGVPYDAHYIDIMKGDQFGSGFVEINPNSKIPALLDVNGPLNDGKSVRVFESGSILLYLAEKYSSPLLPTHPAKRAECINWLMFQMGSAPFFGQYGHFTKYASEKIPYAIARYTTEAQRILDVINRRLKETEYIAGDELTIADIALWPWVSQMTKYHEGAANELNWSRYTSIHTWLAKLGARPAFQLGSKINTSLEGGKYRNHSSEGTLHRPAVRI